MIMMSGPYFIKPLKLEQLLSTENLLTETGSQPKFHKVYIVTTGASLISFAKQRNLLSSIFCLASFMNMGQGKLGQKEIRR